MNDVAAGLSGGGQPLEAGARDQLSSRFGHDFSAVRVHVGPEAHAATRRLGAKAYTVGNDVAFSPGAYDPLTASGRSLIAHELAHVAQHGGHPHAPNFAARDAVHLPPASAALERQAELAAALSSRPLPRGWTWQRATTPFMGRAEKDWVPFPVGHEGQQHTVTEVTRLPEDPAAVRVELDTFMLPRSKGPWLQVYQAVADRKALQAVIEVSGKNIRAGLWEKRAPTPELRTLWLQRVQWPTDKAAQWWREAGGDSSTAFDPRTQGRPAQIDHIVELQLGGTNVPENLAPHTDTDNMASGREIWQELRSAASDVARVLAQHPEDGAVKSIALRFAKVEQAGTYDVGQPDTLPADQAQRAAVIERRAGKAKNALQVHFTALADLAARTRPDAKERARLQGELAARIDYPITAGPSTATLRVPPQPNGADPIEGDSANDPAREAISGLVLEKLTRSTGDSGDEIIAWLNSPEHPVRSKSRLPLAIKDVDERLTLQVTDPLATGNLKLKGGSNRVRFTYPYLSQGVMGLQLTAQGLVGKGTLTPSVPLLGKVPIDLTLDNDGLHASKDFPKDRLKLPPFEVTDASLHVDLGPKFVAGGHLGLELGKIVTGDLEAGADAEGLFAKGQLRGNIRGLNEATATVEYRPHTGVHGQLRLAAAPRTGLVTGGLVVVDFADGGWSASGSVDLMLLGNPAKLTAERRAGGILYTGEARVTVPGLNPVDLKVSYDGENVTGSGRTTFTILGMQGDMHLAYAAGHVTGHGTVHLKRGKVNGELAAKLDEQGRISGSGHAMVEIRPGLVGQVGVVLSPEHKLRVSGELRFPPYTFLEPRDSRFQLFHYDLPEIPLFAIPLGPRSIGLVAQISAGMSARYGFGPGQIRDMVIAAAFNPLEQDADVDVGAQATLVIPAYAGLELSLRAGVGLSVAVASVTGGITVTGGAMLRGGLSAEAKLHYTKHVLSFDAKAGIRVQPVLTLSIDADITAKAALIGEKSWPYNLASYSYATGLEFGMFAPFHYQSDEPLRLPEAKDIEWIVPKIDAAALAKQVGGQVRKGLGL